MQSAQAKPHNIPLIEAQCQRELEVRVCFTDRSPRLLCCNVQQRLSAVSTHNLFVLMVTWLLFVLGIPLPLSRKHKTEILPRRTSAPLHDRRKLKTVLTCTKLMFCLQALEKQHDEELRRKDMKIVLELDQKVMDQQCTLERAGVPGFHVTNNPNDVRLQMYLLEFIIRLSEKQEFSNMGWWCAGFGFHRNGHAEQEMNLFKGYSVVLCCDSALHDQNIWNA